MGIPTNAKPITDEQKAAIEVMYMRSSEELGGLSGSFEGVPCIYLIRRYDDGDGHVNVQPVAILIEGKFLETFGHQMADCDGEPLTPKPHQRKVYFSRWTITLWNGDASVAAYELPNKARGIDAEEALTAIDEWKRNGVVLFPFKMIDDCPP